ncbi:long-chain fatty acid--CoA ligase [Vibrio sp. SS-MA-C1-2]|uniref:AMP-dependent synthetase/ligase n=1 Tax=Vibrio sp. SS-MA-C1-2 TaxID=2908646 RepID=UPI001F2E2623|nr:long-chain fatty acid--CoA ligase [Vibrio sp. SS-MA-C1-2]UJF19139.1 long-chain fatty acid--CoA ligase [Vibrio sp. SS-MA-C1-2]
MTNLDFHLVNRIRIQTKQQGERDALRHNVRGKWTGITWTQFGQKMDELSLALLSVGVNPQDKVAIFANNMPQWTIADFAALQVRGVTVPIYPTNTTDQAAFIINNADAKILFVGDQTQYDQALEMISQCPQLELIVAMKENVDLRNCEIGRLWQPFIEQVSSDDHAIRQAFQQRLDDMNNDDLLTLIYTSGTTGEPKGVMLDYSNFAHQLKSHDKTLKLQEDDVSLSFLPLSHVFERAWTAYVLHRGATNCYLENTARVRQALEQVRPTVMCAVPRFYEKIYSAIHDKVSKAPFIRKALFTWAVNMGAKVAVSRQQGKKPSLLLQKSYDLADKLVLGKLRALLGGNIRFMPCGGAKLDPSIGRFFHAIGINVKLGYGMTETTATVSCWCNENFNPDSIGLTMDGAEVKIGKDNEILVRGNMVMRGYYKREQETAETFTADGFLKTGDAGHFDEDGNLFITDRIKELMKTSNGKYIAPQLIEGKIGKDHFIEQIAVIADTRKFVSALIVPCFDTLEEYAKELNIKYHDRMELVKHSQIIEMFEKRVHEMQGELAKFEQVKKFTLLTKEFSMHKGELTPTLKLRRKVIHDKYKQVIDAMYHDDKAKKKSYS